MNGYVINLYISKFKFLDKKMKLRNILRMLPSVNYEQLETRDIELLK